MSNYNSDKHSNRNNNEVSFNFISSTGVTFKTNKNINTYTATSLSNSMIEKIEVKIGMIMMVERASTMGIAMRVIN